MIGIVAGAILVAGATGMATFATLRVNRDRD